MLYHHTRVDGTVAREEGVVWFRMVSDVDVPYQLHDLLPRENKYMCAQCSNTTQEPVFHAEVSECARAIQGLQLTKTSKSGHPAQPKRQPKVDRPVGAFPCKAALCDKLHYKTAGGSNKHMASNHPRDNLEPYPNPRMAPKPRKKRAPAAALVPAPVPPQAGMPCARKALRAVRGERVVVC